MGEIYYRYVDGYLDDDNYPWMDVIKLEQYLVLKRTECGVWIRNRNGVHYVNGNFIIDRKFILEHYRFTDTKTNKRFAWPTKEEALISYTKRKEKQIWLLKNQLERAKQYLEKANELKDSIK
jgi:hypothetical protein